METLYRGKLISGGNEHFTAGKLHEFIVEKRWWSKKVTLYLVRGYNYVKKPHTALEYASLEDFYDHWHELEYKRVF
jgi:hypothetical protein